MDEQWVTLSRHTDPHDAEWEQAWLAEADIRTELHDDGAVVEVRVAAADVERARAALEPDPEPESPNESQSVSLVDPTVEPDVRLDRLLDRAFLFAIGGIPFPPLLLVAVWHLLRLVVHPNPIELRNWVRAAAAAAVASAAGLGWMWILTGRFH